MAAEKTVPARKGRSTSRPANPAGAPTAAEQTAADSQDKKPRDMPTSAPVAEAGPVGVHVESGDVKVVVAPPGPGGVDRRLYHLINGLPHTTTSDRYVSVLSDLGEGLGWVAGAHIETFKSVTGAKVVAVCSRRKQNAGDLRTKYGIPLKPAKVMLLGPLMHKAVSVIGTAPRVPHVLV